MVKATLLSPNNQFLRLVAIISFFYTASLVPLVGLVFILTLPMVLFVLDVMNHPKNVLAALLSSLVIIALLLFILTNSFMPALAMAAASFSGIAISRTAKKHYAVESVIILPALIILSALAVYLVYGSMQLSVSPWRLLEQHITEAVELNMKFYERLPLKPEEIQAMKEGKTGIIHLFVRIFPALCVMASLLTIWGNAIWGNRLLYKAGKALPRLSALSRWKAPNRLVWIFLAAGGLSFMPQTSIRYAGINIFLVASFGYFLQGLAIVSFFFQTRNISPYFRWIFYFFIAIQQMLMIAIATMGFADLWIDFRKYLQKPPSTD